LVKAGLQSRGVELADGKGSDAALSASGAADQPVPAALDGVGKSGVHDLDEVAITGRKNGHPAMVA
jgi:hypothetical protein